MSSNSKLNGAMSVADPLDDYVLEEQVGNILRRAHQRSSAIFVECFAGFQVTPTQFAALVKLFEMGPVSQNHLGRLCAMDAATMQGLVRRLIERALITRMPDPGHARKLLLSLTPAGRGLVEASLPQARQVTERTLAPLGKEEQTTFLALLLRLV